MKRGEARMMAVVQMKESVTIVRIGLHVSRVGFTITWYRSRAYIQSIHQSINRGIIQSDAIDSKWALTIAVMLIADTKIDVAWRADTNLHVRAPGIQVRAVCEWVGGHGRQETISVWSLEEGEICSQWSRWKDSKEKNVSEMEESNRFFLFLPLDLN